MKKYIRIFLLLTSLTSLSACSDWLEVTPKGQVGANDLLSTSEGYRAALAGVYYTLSQQNMYGQELEYGMIDALSQYWLINDTKHNLYEFTKYNYKNSTVTSKINSIWKQMYGAIGNTNRILEGLEANSTEKISEYNLIKGEALGLRAFMHMELLKMFGPVIANNGMDKPAIPYRTKFDRYAKVFNTSREVIQMAEADLAAAKEALANDPIKDNGRTGNGNINGALNYDGILDWRGARMNYYAVIGLQARLALMKNDKETAYREATDLIKLLKEDKVFRFIEPGEISTASTQGRDLRYSSEMLFSLYVNDLYTITGPLFGYESYTVSTSKLTVDYNNLKNFVYGNSLDGSGDDYRLKYWFPTSGDAIFLKYQEAAKTINMGGWRAYYSEVCLMRLPEIYYIAAESQIGKNNTLALQLLDSVRVSRGINESLSQNTNASDEEVRSLLVNEQRKEFLGEGQLFFLHKRLFRDIIIDQTKTITATEEMFVFPIPQNEYEFSPNEKK